MTRARAGRPCRGLFARRPLLRTPRSRRGLLATRGPRRGLLAAALALVAIGGWTAPPAHSAADYEIGIEDEGLLLDGADEAAAAVDEWKRLGVDSVRLHARWAEIAPAPHATRPPRGFRGDDPDDARYDWAPVDRAMALVRSRGLRVLLTVTGQGPVWASSAPARRNPRWRPRPELFARFATAVARRYGAQVDRYLIWNEPNQGGWLEPQWLCRGRGRARRCAMDAPHQYRALLRAAGPAIKRADPGAQLLIGELAPVGSASRSPRAPIAPLPFLRAFGCVDDRYRPIRTGRCRSFRPAAGDALGYHPHPVRNAPDHHNPDTDEAQLADLGRLYRTLDRLTRARRIRSPGGRRFDVYLTEFGYQTSPPDHAIGITLAQQARYLQVAGEMAWRDPRIRALVHYQWQDEPVLDRGQGKKAYARWQSGLLLITGRPKPAFAVFPTPFVLQLLPGGTRGRFWGQIRPNGPRTVRIERRTPSGWAPIAAGRTDGDGGFARTLPVVRGAQYRFAWDPEDADEYYGLPGGNATPPLTASRGGSSRFRAAAPR